MPVSISQANRLGQRLRHASVPPVEDLRLLGEFRDDHLEAMTAVFFSIVGMPFSRLALSARQKNAHTIVEKLRLPPHIALSRMQDIGGVRVIVSDRLIQRDAAEQITTAFPGARITDRNAEPQAGYRALHVVVRTHEKQIEVQVRTALQNRWAQAFERLGDHWGRQIRRGQPPDDPSRVTIVGGAELTRDDVVNYMRSDVSSEIAEAEQHQLHLLSLQRRLLT
ncbi:MAG TPA: hypothetical protein VFK85_04015, partial [Anaeromyxobacteraceae bacterium]|nr:hypothetical protein [Anaeromyxobacteraceae bacterium]